MKCLTFCTLVFGLGHAQGQICNYGNVLLNETNRKIANLIGLEIPVTTILVTTDVHLVSYWVRLYHQRMQKGLKRFWIITDDAKIQPNAMYEEMDKFVCHKYRRVISAYKVGDFMNLSTSPEVQIMNVPLTDVMKLRNKPNKWPKEWGAVPPAANVLIIDKDKKTASDIKQIKEQLGQKGGKVIRVENGNVHFEGI